MVSSIQKYGVVYTYHIYIIYGVQVAHYSFILLNIKNEGLLIKCSQQTVDYWFGSLNVTMPGN